MTDETFLAVAVASAMVAYALGWYAVRRFSFGWKIAARVMFLGLFLGPLALVMFQQPLGRGKSAETQRQPDVRPKADVGRTEAKPSPAPSPYALPAPAPATSAPRTVTMAPSPPGSVPQLPSTEPAAGGSTSGGPTTGGSREVTGTLWDVVQVFYGTDRQRGSEDKRLTYSAVRAGRLELGRADITVPKSHQVPNIERPFAIRVPFTSITLYEASEDPTKHFTIRELKGLTEAAFLDEVRARLARSQTFKDRAFVFIHGYNTDFDFALFRTAQMAYDLKYDGAAFLYSWPSASGIAGYISDRDSAEQAEPYLRAFLDVVIRDTGAKNVSVIAHSMGNLPLLRVLRNLEPRLPAGVKVDQVILAAPDVDRALFEQLAVDVTKVGRGVTLYASSKDRAMAAARLVTGGSPRAGDVSAEGPMIIAGIDSIDVSSTTMDSLTMGHSLYAERGALLTDIAALLQTGLRPPDRRMPTFLRVETAKGAYWRVP